MTSTIIPGGWVLLIEDDEDLRDAMAALLRCQGCQVAEASGGEEALRLLRSGIRPFLILLDLMMPSMSGQEFKVAFDADSSLPRAPIIILSADGRIANIADAMGAHGFVRKPPELDEFCRLVESFRGTGGAEATM